MKTLLFFTAFLCLIFSAGYSQTRQITGQVTDEITKESLPSVSVKGPNQTVATDPDGKFRISVPTGAAKLTFTSIGYVTQTITITNQKTLNVQLQSDSKGLNEIIVIGYGAVRKRDLTGAVVSVKGEELKKIPSANIMESLQGKVQGADITLSSGQPGAAVNITLRGNRSIVGSNNPLYIVDGSIFYGSILDLNTNDIQSVDVLKDASSTAIYGSRGANGVIIITTKKGTIGHVKISLNSFVGVSQATSYAKSMTGPQYIDFKRQANRTSGIWNSVADDPKIFNSNELTAIKDNIWTDYADLLLHNGLQQSHSIGLSSGTEKTKIYSSLNYFKEDGLLKNDNLKKYSGRFNLDQIINKVIKVGLQTQVTYYDQNMRRDPFNQANKITPLGSAYDAGGNIITYPNQGSVLSPLADEIPDNYSNQIKSGTIFSTGYLEAALAEGLTFRTNLSATINNMRTGTYQGTYTIDRNGSLPRSIYNTSTGNDLLWDNILTYQKKIQKHAFILTGITSYQKRVSDSGNEQGDGQLLPAQSYFGLGTATSGVLASTNFLKQNIVSFSGRLNYTYNDKYLLTLTGRSDGSSKLAPGHKWTFFPSAAFAWRIIDENFMKDSKVISDLKLRISYGVAGNDPYNPYVTQSLLVSSPYTYNGSLSQGYAFNPITGNPDLEWERSTTGNIGLDLGFLENRIVGTIDVYDTKTNHLLLPRVLPTSTGVSSTVQNVGQTENKGIEIGITTNNLSSKDWAWTTSLSFTKNDEKIKQLVTPGLNDIASGYFIGYPTAVVYDYEKIGIWQTQEATEAAKYGQVPGSIRIKDQNNDGKIDATHDRVVLGSPRPKWSGGIDNTIKYKSFDFNVYVFARIGQFFNVDYLARFKPQAIENIPNHDYWTPENPTNAYPRPNSASSQLYTSTLGYADGSFVRIRTISLGYSLPSALIKKAHLNSLRINATAKNFFTFSKIKNYDPERGGSESFPMTKMITFGLNADF